MTGANDRVAECAFCVGAGNERFSDETELGGVVNVVAGLVCLESCATAGSQVAGRPQRSAATDVPEPAAAGP